MNALARAELGTDTLLIGNDAGWLLSFHPEIPDPRFLPFSADRPFEIGRDQYYAQIQASLPGGLEGGVYSFVIEGLIEEHYRQLKATPTLVARLFLYWRDTNASAAGYFKSLAGLTDFASGIGSKDITDALVAVLTVVSISRRAGARAYETTITARERAFEMLNGRRVCGNAIEAAPEDAVTQLLVDRVNFRDFEFHGLNPHPIEKYVPVIKGSESDGRQKVKAGGTALDLLRQIGNRLEEKTGRYGRGMFLIRNGILHIGTRSIPLRAASSAPGATPTGDVEGTQPLHPGNGLIEVEALESAPTDPNFDFCAGGAPGAVEDQPRLRRQFKLTLKGRPDIKPGAAVMFDSPDDEDAGFGQSRTVFLYVSTVEHRLGRTSGFVTTLSGVEFTSEVNQWDGHTPASKDNQRIQASSDVNVATSAGKAVQRLVQSQIETKRFAEVCEVRAGNTQGRAEPPAQTIDVVRGLEPGDGDPNQSRRLAINRQENDRATGVAYAAPFAWGKCGLVLPRYPGTRVLTVHRQGRIDDAIDVGAIWESGHGPDSQPGDWWLILPAGIPAEKRRQIAADETPQEHQGSVTQDLIDADGNRVIEVGQLSIVVVAQDKLKKAGERPQHGTHVPGGASIIVKPDGSVVIKAKRIEFDAGDGDITMKAKNVNVSVSGAMDVS